MPEKTPAEYAHKLMAVLEETASYVAMAAGVRQQFIDIGLNPEQASEMTVMLFRGATNAEPSAED